MKTSTLVDPKENQMFQYAYATNHWNWYRWTNFIEQRHTLNNKNSLFHTFCFPSLGSNHETQVQFLQQYQLRFRSHFLQLMFLN